MAGWWENYIRTSREYVDVIAGTIGGTAGQAVGALLTVPQGYMWRLVRYSVFSNSAGTPTFELLVGTPNEQAAPNFAPDRSRRLDYTANGKNNISDNSAPPVFFEGEVPIFYWASASNGDRCQACVEVAWYEILYTTSHRSAHSLTMQEHTEDEQRKEAVVVGGSGWNAGIVLPDGLDDNGYQPWASRDPADAASNPAQWDLGEGQGQYVGGVEEGPQHPKPPYDGRILPDGSTDSTS